MDDIDPFRKSWQITERKWPSQWFQTELPGLISHVVVKILTNHLTSVSPEELITSVTSPSMPGGLFWGCLLWLVQLQPVACLLLIFFWDVGKFTDFTIDSDVLENLVTAWSFVISQLILVSHFHHLLLMWGYRVHLLLSWL